MKFNYKYTILSLLAPLMSIAQVKIAETNSLDPNTEININNRALLEIESNGKGMILPRVADISSLPNYDLNAPDLFSNNPLNAGMLIYVESENDIMKYDGYKWIKSNEKSVLNYKNVSVIGSTSENIVQANVLGITTRPILKFDNLRDIDYNLINNLGLSVDSEGSIVFSKTGYYKINPSVKILSSGGLSVGNNSTIISLQALFVDDSERQWRKIHENSYLLAGLVVTAAANNSVNSFSVIKYFKAGDKIRIKGGIQADEGLNLGSGVTFAMKDKDTFLFIEKLD
ncbi:MAG: hypothetical protein KIG88_03520 [Weeksellaceae bacterium]|nr:hypothetical protein [Weeksellaceae bacterium]